MIDSMRLNYFIDHPEFGMRLVRVLHVLGFIACVTVIYLFAIDDLMYSMLVSDTFITKCLLIFSMPAIHYYLSAQIKLFLHI